VTTHEFTFVLDHALDDDEIDALFDAGCDDATPEIEQARTLLHFDRDAPNLADALVSALDNVQASGLQVVAVESNDLVTVKDIAARTGRTYESVRLLAAGKRGPGGFPAPMAPGGWQFYSWAQVSQWFATNVGGVREASTYDRIIAAADHLVRARAILAGDKSAALLAHLVT
jgi:hypothetical protein